MSPTSSPKLEAYIFFDNQSDRPLFLRLMPREGKLHVTLSDYEEEGFRQIDRGRIVAILVTPDIRTCLHGNKIRMIIKFQIKVMEPKLEIVGPSLIRDIEGRGRGPLFRVRIHID